MDPSAVLAAAGFEVTLMIYWVIAGLLFTTIATWTAFLFSALWGTLTVEIARISLAVGAISGLGYLVSRDGFPRVTITKQSSALIFLVALFFLSSYFLKIYFYDAGLWSTARIYEMNLPLNLARITHLTGSPKFQLESSLWPVIGVRDIGGDLFAALWIKNGVPLTSFLPVCAFAGAIFALCSLALWSPSFGLPGFLFFGGTTGVLLIFSGILKSLAPYLTPEFMRYSALPFFQYLSQSEWFFALPAGLVLLRAWHRRFFEKQPVVSPVTEVFLWSALSLFHFLSFLFFSFLFVLWWWASREPFKKYFFVFPGVLFLSAPFILLQGFSFFDRAWFPLSGIEPRAAAPWILGLLYFGYTLPWLLAAAFWVRKNREGLLSVIVYPALCLYALAGALELRTSTSFGAGILVWCTVMMFRPLGEWIVHHAHISRRFGLLFVMLLPGLWVQPKLSEFYAAKVPLVSHEELRAVCDGISRLPNEFRFATAMRSNHPVAFCGHPVVSAYPESFFKEGSPERLIAGKLRRFMSGAEDWRELAEELRIRYVFWGPSEDADFPDSPKPWEFLAWKVTEGPWGRIFDLGNRKLISPLPEFDQGLVAKIYGNKEWKGPPLFRQTVGRIEFDNEHFNRRLIPNLFGIVFEGEILIPETGMVTFYLLSDDGSDLTVDGRLIVDNGGDHAPRVMKGARFFKSGWYPIRLRYNDNGGLSVLHLLWEFNNQAQTIVPASYFRWPVRDIRKKKTVPVWHHPYNFKGRDTVLPVPETRQGLMAYFYQNTGCDGEPLMVQRVSGIDFHWEDPPPELMPQPFAIFFQGKVFIPEPGEVTFYLASDDGSQMSLNGKLIIDNAGPHPMRVQSAKVVLEKEWYPIEIRFFDTGGVASVRLWWTLPSGHEGLIPTENFRIDTRNDAAPVSADISTRPGGGD